MHVNPPGFFGLQSPKDPPKSQRPINFSTAQISYLPTLSLPEPVNKKKGGGGLKARQNHNFIALLIGLSLNRSSMAEHEPGGESLVDKLTEKIHSHDSSSDSDDYQASKDDGDSLKSNVYRLFGREKPVHKVLGGGKPADVFLWRDKKISAGVLGVATIIWVLFELVEYHLITLTCHISIMALAILFLWSNASTFIKKSPPQIPELVIPEKCLLEVAAALRIEINRALAVLHDIASGRDMKEFLAIIVGLWILSVVGNWFSFLTLLYISFVLLHTLPVVYEKYEDLIDPLAEKAMVEIKKQYAVFDEKVLSKIPKGVLKEKKKD